MTRLRVLAALACVCGIGAAGAPPAVATDYLVTNLQDDALTGPPGSLRAAIRSANAHEGPDRILFGSGARQGTLPLTAFQGLDTITGPLSIIGPGSGAVIIDGQNNARAFLIQTTPPGAAVTISGLRLDRNNSPGDGGAIRNVNSALTLRDVAVTNSGAGGAGGGLHSADGAVTITDSSFVNNTADAAGGIVVYADEDEPVAITGTDIAQNDATVSSAGGLDLDSADTVTVRDSRVTGNTTPSFGGGMTLGFNSGPVLIEDTTVDGNTAQSDSGGIELVNNGLGTIVLRNVTVSGNTGDWGGGMKISPYGANPVLLDSVTVAGNTGDERGGGMFVLDGGGAPVPRLVNSVVADNVADEGADLYVSPGANPAPTPIVLAYSLVEAANPGATVTFGHALLGVDPMLGPLADNGGPTPTRALLPGSPVIDQGLTSLTSDQRGLLRPADRPGSPNAAGGNGADMGAFEVQLPPKPKPICKGKRATIVASGARTTGTRGADVIVGRRGADVIDGRGGKDLICGRAGGDAINGGKGNDRLYGEGGRDKLRGGPGKDALRGGPAADTLVGGPGRDVLRGGPGRDSQTR